MQNLQPAKEQHQERVSDPMDNGLHLRPGFGSKRSGGYLQKLRQEIIPGQKRFVYTVDLAL